MIYSFDFFFGETYNNEQKLQTYLLYTKHDFWNNVTRIIQTFFIDFASGKR